MLDCLPEDVILHLDSVLLWQGFLHHPPKMLLVELAVRVLGHEGLEGLPYLGLGQPAGLRQGLQVGVAQHGLAVLSTHGNDPHFTQNKEDTNYFPKTFQRLSALDN